MTKAEAKALLTLNRLRVTGPRIAVLLTLAAADRPLSHTEVVRAIGDADWDPATVYRNLIKLKDSGLASVVNRAQGQDRYALASTHAASHQHPHFVCDDCGEVSCLPAELTYSELTDQRWARSVKTAQVQLRGACPDCQTA